MKKTYLSTKNIIVTMMAASASLLSAQTFASGYGLHEVSPSLMGNAYAGNSTSDEDISGMRFNPAILGMADDHQMYLSATGIFPEVDASNVRNNVSGVDAVPGDPFPVQFSISQGPSKASDVANDAFVPAAFFAWHINDDFNLGLAVTAPWGLSTRYNEDWDGRYFAIDTDLKSVNINPIISWSWDDHFSIAAGFQAQYLNANLTQKIPVADKVAPTPFPPFAAVLGVDDVYSRVKGDGWGYGWSLGGLYEFTEDTRIGVGFQSKIDTEIKGNATSDGTSPLSDEVASTLIGKANTHITTPEVINLGISHDIDPCWTVMANIEWTHWSRFRDLHIQIDGVDGQVDTVVYEDWENTYFYSIGADFRPIKDLVLRAGVGFDQTPIESQHRNPTVPDSDRNLFSVGAGYNITDDIRIDVAYMYLRFHDASVNQEDLSTGVADNTKSLEADYSGHVNLVSLGLEYVF